MENVIWIIFEVVVNIYQGFMCAYFVLKFLTPKTNTNVKMYMLLSSGTQILLLTLMNYYSDFEGIGSILYWFGLFLFAVKMLNGNMVKKAFASMVPLLTAFIITTLDMNFIAATNNMSISELVHDRSIARITLLLSIQLVYYLSLKIILKLFQTNEEQFKVSEWGVVIAAISFSIVMAALLHNISININDYSLRFLINISLLILLIVNILIFNLINSLIKKNNSLREFEMLKLHEQYQSQYVENARLQYDSVKKMRHDLKNQFLTIYTLLNDKKNNEAMSYLKKNIDNIKSIDSVINTSNIIVNAVINSKLSMAETMGIDVSCFSVNSFDGIDDIDLCNLLSNSLDNAIAACRKISETETRIISLKIDEEEKIYTFLIQNSIKDSVLNTNPKLLTTKQDKKLHGFGTKILNDISKKYGGRCDFYEKEKIFCCKIILKAK